MEVYVSRDELTPALAAASKAAGSDGPLSHVLIEASKESLAFTAHNTESGVRHVIEGCNVEKPGEAAVSARDFFQVARSLPEQTVALRLGARHLVVASGRSRFKLAMLITEDVPPPPRPTDAEPAGDLTKEQAHALFGSTAYAISPDAARFGLNGLHLEVGDGRVLAVSTDGHRLARASCEADLARGLPKRALIPPTAAKVLAAADGPVQLAFSDKPIHMQATAGRSTWWFRLVDGEFPNWKAILPEGARTTVRIRTDALVAACKRVQIAQSERAVASAFSFEEDALTIQHRSLETSVQEVLVCEVDGEAVRMGFNVQYVLDAVKNLRTPEVRIGINGPLSPTLFGDPEGDAHVVMPMRLD